MASLLGGTADVLRALLLPATMLLFVVLCWYVVCVTAAAAAAWATLAALSAAGSTPRPPHMAGELMSSWASTPWESLLTRSPLADA